MNRDLFFFAIAAFLLGFVLFRRFAGKVAPEQAKTLVDGGAKLVDVRTSAEHAAGHIPGSVHIPLGELADRTGELGDKGAPLVVYCASGMRSATATGILKRAGFTQVHDLGGMSRWRG